jgi:hypothetical protein
MGSTFLKGEENRYQPTNGEKRADKIKLLKGLTVELGLVRRGNRDP